MCGHEISSPMAKRILGRFGTSAARARAAVTMRVQRRRSRIMGGGARGCHSNPVGRGTFRPGSFLRGLPRDASAALHLQAQQRVELAEDVLPIVGEILRFLRVVLYVV